MHDHIDDLLREGQRQGFRLVPTKDNHLKVYAPDGAFCGLVSQAGAKQKESYNSRRFFLGLRGAMRHHGFKDPQGS